MSADINRKSLDPKETHFSQMLFHQGRVMLPSDLNENGAIFQYYLRQFIMDFVGKHWRAGAESFKISDIEIDKKTFKISKGHFYVDGILCVNEVDCFYSPTGNKTGQPMFPTPEWDEVSKDFPRNFAVYLECCERHVNWIQRPQIQIREVALGGRDTSSRLEIAWQVRVLTIELANSYVTDITDALNKRNPKPDVMIKTIKNTFNNFKERFDNSQTKHCNATQDLLEILDDADPKLRVWAQKSADATDPCSISPDAQYRGLENQLYRVEIHRPGIVRVDNGSMQPKPSFKWSRENGSVVFPIIKVESSLSAIKSENVVTLIVDLDILGRDNRYGLCVNDWVELINDEIEFGQKVLPLAQIMKIDSTLGRLTLISTISKGNTTADFSHCTMLRRWDQTENCNKVNKEGTINIEKEGDEDEYGEDSWVLLERGIKIQFQPGGNYRKGDYWLIPARVATGDVEWPKKKGKEVPEARSTDGIKRHRAALGVVIDRSLKDSCGCTVDPACETNS
jgi:hypothetical protein